MLSALQSIWTWTAIAVLLLVWLPLLAVVRLFDRDPAHYRTGRWFRRVGMAMTKVNPAWHIEITGEHPDNPRHPYIVVSNHQSNADIPIISCLPWEMKWVAKASLFRFPVVGWMLRLAGDIPVNRRDKISRARVLVHAKQVLAKNCSVMFFPEGTRSRDTRVHRFSDGAFRLAIKAQLPILPLAIDGTQDALPKHSWQFGRAEAVKLKVLPPISTTGLTADDTPALRERVRQQIIGELASWRNVLPETVDALASRKHKDSINMPTPARS